jgi:hypothetical protein
VGICGLDSSLRIGTVAGYCEYGNKSSCSIKEGNFLTI